MTYQEILLKKKRLLEGLANNIFSEFSDEDNLYLHSKHGYIRVYNLETEVFSGKVAAFKCNLPLVNSENISTSKVQTINWFQTTLELNNQWYNFDYTPINLKDLLNNLNTENNESTSNQ